mgnify:CR=1 FL=1
MASSLPRHEAMAWVAAVMLLTFDVPFDHQAVDFAVETAKLTRAQILTQAGTSVLATANTTPQSVLSLLQ